MIAPTRSHLCTLALLLGTLVPASSCVTPPSPSELLAYGFDTPVQAFQSFVVALRADLPHYEYRCFSSGFKSRNEISRSGYLMFRDQLLKDQPLLKWALQKASRKPECYSLTWGPNGRHAKLEVDVSGRSLHVLLARECYQTVLGQPTEDLAPAEKWLDQSIGDLEADEWIFPMPSGKALGAQAYPLDAQAYPLMKRDLDRFISMTVGREWKIDDIYLAEEASP
ncbi:MAG: hypothetical protein GY930_17665 [bacterium]|nr:hypothetical protein [bacterium]